MITKKVALIITAGAGAGVAAVSAFNKNWIAAGMGAALAVGAVSVAAADRTIPQLAAEATRERLSAEESTGATETATVYVATKGDSLELHAGAISARIPRIDPRQTLGTIAQFWADVGTRDRAILYLPPSEDVNDAQDLQAAKQPGGVFEQLRVGGETPPTARELSLLEGEGLTLAVSQGTPIVAGVPMVESDAVAILTALYRDAALVIKTTGDELSRATLKRITTALDPSRSPKA